MVKAALLREQGGPLELCEIELPAPGPRQVRIRISAAGVCHSDLSLANGTLTQPVPAVLGHEGAGVVVEIGSEVTRVAVGDKVVLNWSPACGECWFCDRDEPYLCEGSVASEASAQPYATLADGTPVYAGLGTGAFAEETVVDERAAVKVPDQTDLSDVAVMGCAVLTGAGAVFHTADVQPGQSVVIIGLGGIGLSVAQAARVAGAHPIIGVDMSEEKGKVAAEHGVTDFVPSGPDAARAIRKLTGGRGADHAFDCVGGAVTTRSAWSSTRRGGVVTVVGVGSKDSKVEFSALELYWFGRTLHGCIYGRSNPDVDVPHLLELAAQGEMDIAALRTAITDLAGIDKAFDDMREGRGIRTVVSLEQG
ncbi:alcohol dehydrogenase catalytic domain-containing protein [Gordonia hydrophobica]|uniref:Alcohol dehydrogenase catalytic domain-containing protein n=1 Tax=Gordonia hydrophobica TaxID=40516 RepID=A0ABZ2TY49_9ACTN|nr:alcohol dehydrogenase catalytic domain-containing protein [Gordonia hydrophobica]MBM7366566.1 S-(hydroxymethyl)glutathione dehydrogenase/alcohol dehydrogenase [Gordonia hydrophobica]